MIVRTARAHVSRARALRLRDGFASALAIEPDLAAELGATGHLERLERELASA